MNQGAPSLLHHPVGKAPLAGKIHQPGGVAHGGKVQGLLLCFLLLERSISPRGDRRCAGHRGGILGMLSWRWGLGSEWVAAQPPAAACPALHPSGLVLAGVSWPVSRSSSVPLVTFWDCCPQRMSLPCSGNQHPACGRGWDYPKTPQPPRQLVGKCYSLPNLGPNGMSSNFRA